MEEAPKYESGICGMAEVRFGGKIMLGIVQQKNTGNYGISLAEFYQQGNVGDEPPMQQHHDPQVFLVFDNIKSVEMLEQCLMTVRENMKRDAEKAFRENIDSEIKSLLEKPIVELNLSVRTTNVLTANRINTVRDLVRMQKKDFVRFRNSGSVSLAEVDDFISENNLQWGMNV